MRTNESNSQQTEGRCISFCSMLKNSPIFYSNQHFLSHKKSSFVMVSIVVLKCHSYLSILMNPFFHTFRFYMIKQKEIQHPCPHSKLFPGFRACFFTPSITLSGEKLPKKVFAILYPFILVKIPVLTIDKIFFRLPLGMPQKKVLLLMAGPFRPNGPLPSQR